MSVARDLDWYGWHREGCFAYVPSEDVPDESYASEADDRVIPCSCGFREALDRAIEIAKALS